MHLCQQKKNLSFGLSPSLRLLILPSGNPTGLLRDQANMLTTCLNLESVYKVGQMSLNLNPLKDLPLHCIITVYCC